MDRGAWRATVHGVAESDSEATEHTLNYTRRQKSTLSSQAGQVRQGQAIGGIIDKLGVFLDQRVTDGRSL